ncbi:phage tail tape measure protein [Maritimibacter sp. UBA3975]|uniref:phage tail tape measure protein n=1 Tax=Maritimibacter sp. UBA3975 TaxID=1946833 RepID=UPI000C0BB115|nr:phage tail tape measure protein [Maritimibacter sp. UBA3975]MAM61062.1 phage tail protein [Maritimibacter sp.]|tara:strand:- start:3167 stop:3826 length:660 start_codon:yes stop_codon:yes gene_type:complete
MADIENLDEFDDQVAALEGSLQGATALTAHFTAEIERVGATFDKVNTDISGLSSGMSRGLRKSLDGLVYGSMNAEQALASLGKSMLDTVYDTAVSPMVSHFGGLLGQGLGTVMNAFLPYANGGAFSQGRVMPFANGGVVNGPVTFPMRGGTGLMGEAGPEAIMPLALGPDGKLGVRSAVGGTVNVTMNISTPDAESFRRSQGQVAAQVNRVLGRGRRYS